MTSDPTARDGRGAPRRGAALPPRGRPAPDVTAHALDVLPVGVVVHDVAGRLVRANTAAVLLLGLGTRGAATTEVPIGRGGEPLDASRHPTASTVRTRVAADGLLGLRAAGGTRWLRVAARPLTDDAGTPIGTVTTYVDVSDELAAAGPPDSVPAPRRAPDHGGDSAPSAGPHAA